MGGGHVTQRLPFLDRHVLVEKGHLQRSFKITMVLVDLRIYKNQVNSFAGFDVSLFTCLFLYISHQHFNQLPLSFLSQIISCWLWCSLCPNIITLKFLSTNVLTIEKLNWHKVQFLLKSLENFFYYCFCHALLYLLKL